MQGFVDAILGIVKELLKALVQEIFNFSIRLINGISALILMFLPGKRIILENFHGWQLYPTLLRAPRLPRWMEPGVTSSFNQFLRDYATRNTNGELESESSAEDNDMFTSSRPSTQSFHGSRVLPRCNSSSSSLSVLYGKASKRAMSFKDFVIHHSTDGRRGIIEDLQVLVELSIERLFDVVRNMLLLGLSPLQMVKFFMGKLVFTSHDGNQERREIQTDTLGDPNPAPSVKRDKRFTAMNTDARSCEDIIKDLGYPYEAMRVVTEDGHVLLLERIARPASRKVLYLQHGMLDSSMGWVKNGVVGSHAFAAHDHGYDVFLGNFRGLASQEHLDPKISSQRYWKFSVDEHATKDMPAIIEKIHQLKMKELHDLNIIGLQGSDLNTEQPYSICGVAHSLGGTVFLMYVVTRRLCSKPHRLSRLVLLSPAGFHKEMPSHFKLLQYFFPAFAPIGFTFLPGLCIKTWIIRALFNKLVRDFWNYPALGALVQLFFSYFIGGGDSSNWLDAIGQTHYNVNDMPGISYRVIVHMAQMRRSDRFQMYDHGRAANLKIYGTPCPLDIGKHYGQIDIPVDLVAGSKDRLIPKSNIKRHHELLIHSGVTASYREFKYAHLEFTIAYKEDLLAYVMSRLLLVTSPSLSPKGIMSGSF